uniref:Uncharacterized protein n=1 Tax=Oryza brachyantha TaxID=4533 RepID=J3MLA9_ORYBR
MVLPSSSSKGRVSKKLAVEAKGRAVSKKPSGSPAVSMASSPAPALPRNPPDASVSFKTGDQVRVRTPVGRLLPSTLRLVLWLGAVVVADGSDGDHDGHLGVLYNGNFPRDDPFRTVRVAIKDVKLPAVDHTAPPPPSDSTATAAPRRSKGGGKCKLLLLKEMQANSDAASTR